MIDTVGRKDYSRRDFLKASSCALLLSRLGFPQPAAAQKGEKGYIRSRPCSHFVPLKNRRIQCQLCPRECVVSEGQRGFCGVRENQKGQYFTLVYGNPCAVHGDPIEKKPFYHILPASTTFSLATAGCNLRCKFCQNWEISQTRPDDTYNYDLSPERIVTLVKKGGFRSIAYSYTEPTVFYEYMVDTARLAKKEGILNLCHSNGFIKQGPLSELCKLIDGANIDLKGFTEDFYGQMTQGRLAPVLESLKTLKREKVHLEITNLMIPTVNDSPESVRKMCVWIKNELGAETPIHFSRFYPLYKLRNLPPTPVATLEKSRQIAMEAGLHYVYIGNVPGHEGEKTYCAQCRKTVIDRQGYFVREVHLAKGKCKFCGQSISGIWT